MQRKYLFIHSIHSLWVVDRIVTVWQRLKSDRSYTLPPREADDLSARAVTMLVMSSCLNFLHVWKGRPRMSVHCCSPFTHHCPPPPPLHHHTPCQQMFSSAPFPVSSSCLLKVGITTNLAEDSSTTSHQPTQLLSD